MLCQTTAAIFGTDLAINFILHAVHHTAMGRTFINITGFHWETITRGQGGGVNALTGHASYNTIPHAIIWNNLHDPLFNARPSILHHQGGWWYSVATLTLCWAVGMATSGSSEKQENRTFPTSWFRRVYSQLLLSLFSLLLSFFLFMPIAFDPLQGNSRSWNLAPIFWHN